LRCQLISNPCVSKLLQDGSAFTRHWNRVILNVVMEPRMIQHQSQKLILSPQIRQYLKLLQMPVAELKQAVQAELSENPMLEEPVAPSPEETSPAPEEAASREGEATAELRLGESFERFRELDENFREGYQANQTSLEDPRSLQKWKNFQDSLITKPEALSDFLLWQIRFMDFTEKEKKIAIEIIGNINEEGYLKASLEEIQASSESSHGEVAEVLKEIQYLDPPGIGARDLREALSIQLKKKGPEAALALKIVSEHLALLEKRDWRQLAKILQVDIGAVKKAAQSITRLEPRPGRTFYVEEPIAVTPDATISFEDDQRHKLRIEVHDEHVPELRINVYYRRLLRDKSTDPKAKAFLRDKMVAAVNFLKALQLRKSTLRDMTEEIVKAQPDFFEKGFAHLRPLRLKDIASNLGVHESTVSRALHGKYISTPQGTIPYKSFFSTKLATTHGEVESQKSIMVKIQHMVNGENPKSPLSDQTIVGTLQGEGIQIARRTVAKYRDLLKILPSHLRRQR